MPDCLGDFGPFHCARLGYPLSLPIGGASATKGHDCNNREMLPMAIFIPLDIYDLFKNAYFREMLLIELVRLLCHTCLDYNGATYIKPSKHNKKWVRRFHV